jgi:hypothetical protein
MNTFKYDTHIHTSEASACASCSGAEQASVYHMLGYTGIIITDHFFKGNSCIPRELPWKERVELFALGYENALKEGEKIGLSVFFGWEESFFGTDFLVYGLDKHWLMKHPDMEKWDLPDYYRQVHKDGGFFVHAHPFRRADYISEIRLLPEFEDGIEVMNWHNKEHEYNIRAFEYAKQVNKPITGGSDAHNINEQLGGMIFDHRLENIQDFIKSVNGRKGVNIIY